MSDKQIDRVNCGVSAYDSVIMAGMDKDGKLTCAPLRRELISRDPFRAIVKTGGDAIPDGYQLTATFYRFLKIYDDNGLARKFWGREINVYRIGKAGIIVQILED